MMPETTCIYSNYILLNVFTENYNYRRCLQLNIFTVNTFFYLHLQTAIMINDA
jgi:hypothetical protein